MNPDDRANLRKVDRILVFQLGRIIEDGHPSALLALPAEHYRRLRDLQALEA